MVKYLVVKNLSHLYALQNHEDGELAYVESDKKVYVWHPEDGWQLIDIENKGLELNLYDLNKNLMNQMEPWPKERLWQEGNDIIFKFFTTEPYDKHYMLLCAEYHYYTIFDGDADADATDDFTSTVLGIVEELGPVYSIDKTEDGDALEFWIKPLNQPEPLVFLLFPYDRGVVRYV